MNSMIRTMGRFAAVALVALLLAGLGTGVATAEKESASVFKSFCTDTGGALGGDSNGNIYCVWGDGSSMACDGNGKNCVYLPAPLTRPDEPTVLQSPGAHLATRDGGTSGGGQITAPAQEVEEISYQR